MEGSGGSDGQGWALADGALALAAEGESGGLAALAHGDAQSLEVDDGVHVGRLQLGQLLPLHLLLRVHLLRVRRRVAHQQPRLHQPHTLARISRGLLTSGAGMLREVSSTARCCQCALGLGVGITHVPVQGWQACMEMYRTANRADWDFYLCM